VAQAVPTGRSLEEQIVEALRRTREELHTEELAAQLGLSRHTVSKYLQILYAKGSVRMRRVGNAKLWRAADLAIEVRPLLPEDLPQILRIEERLQQIRQAALPSSSEAWEAERETFTQTVEYHLEYGDPTLCLGAEIDGELVGYIIGEVRLWEFGGGEKTGWIKILAVDPDYQRQGIGRRLGEELLRQFRRRGIRRVRTLVDSYSGELIAYFRSLGFQVLSMLPLELQMDAEGKETDDKRLPFEDLRSKAPSRKRGGE
jgi:ribosomal protein S18 acetylase RimI-like enzyme